MTKDEALRLALEALEVTNSLVDGYYLPKEKAWMPEIEEAITAIKAALEAKDEPVAWMRTSGTGSPVVTEELLVEMPEMRWNFQQPLYTTPTQLKPLSEKEMNVLGTQWHFNLLEAKDKADLFAFARAIEAAHGIKGEE